MFISVLGQQVLSENQILYFVTYGATKAYNIRPETSIKRDIRHAVGPGGGVERVELQTKYRKKLRDGKSFKAYVTFMYKVNKK